MAGKGYPIGTRMPKAQLNNSFQNIRFVGQARSVDEAVLGAFSDRQLGQSIVTADTVRYA